MAGSCSPSPMSPPMGSSGRGTNSIRCPIARASQRLCRGESDHSSRSPLSLGASAGVARQSFQLGVSARLLLASRNGVQCLGQEVSRPA
jgi:hypothetical protein